MSSFRLKKYFQSRPKMNVGIHQTAQQLECVWFNAANEPQQCRIPLSESDIPSQLRQQVKQDVINAQLQFIGSISPHLTWLKNLLLPQSLNEQEYDQQCRFILEKESPIPLEQLWFDYTAMPLKEGVLLELCAIRQTAAQQYQQNLCLKTTVLDVAHHSILRAFQYITGKMTGQFIYLYQDEEICLAFSYRFNQYQLLQAKENILALYQQFKLRFPPKSEEKEQVYFFSANDLDLQTLPTDWIKINTDFPFIALGNALWQCDIETLLPAKTL